MRLASCCLLLHAVQQYIPGMLVCEPVRFYLSIPLVGAVLKGRAVATNALEPVCLLSVLEWYK